MPLGKVIPGETPIDDISGLKVKGITKRRELNLLEAENIAKATEKYLIGRLTRKQAPFDFSWALQLHREMFGEVWNWGGVPRKYDIAPVGADPLQIEPLLYDLLARLRYWKDRPWLEQAAWLHHQAVQIHPFPNGNGRWSRMLANIWLHLNKQPITSWPEATVGEASSVRNDYIVAIKKADDNDYEALLELHQRFTT